MGDKETTSLWQMYQNGLGYQTAIGIDRQIPQNVDFFEGRQWGDLTNLKYTKDYPRPVLNIVKMICRNKKSAVLAAPVKLMFRGNRTNDSGQALTQFLEYVQKELKQTDLDNDAIDDAIKKGSYFYHYYWDAQAPGMTGDYEGGVRGEIIDPMNIFFSNPQEKDVQKQKWVLIATREEVNSVRKMADKGIDVKQIRPDESEVKYSTEKEQEGSELCTVLTRYFRKDGEVYFERGTQTVMLHKPRALNPKLVELDKTEEDESEDGLPDKAVERGIDRPKATLYPIAAGFWEKREKSIYGLSEVEDLIPNQKAVNRALAIKLWIGNTQSSSKIVVRSGANGDGAPKINNSPMQILTDHYQGNGNGYYTLPPAQVSPILKDIDTQLISDTRTVSGSTEVLSGEVISSNMSGTAIAALQAQAQKPIDELQRRFYRTRERTGEILVQFAKLFYSNREYSFYDEKTKQVTTETFDGEQYRQERFDVVCEAGSGSVYSDSMMINMLSDLLNKGMIDQKTYISCMPASMLPNKSEFIDALNERENEEVNRLAAENQKLLQEKQQAYAVIQQHQKTVDKVATVINENRNLKEMLAALQAEYTDKINIANQEITNNRQAAEALAVEALKNGGANYGRAGSAV